MPIKLNVSGIRGRFAEFTPHWVTRLVSAFSACMGPGPFLIGSDRRPSGAFIRPAALAGFLAAGAEICDAGIMPTPIMQWLIPRQGFKGGLSITAGHNPFDWNALVFLNREGAYLNQFEGEEFFSFFHAGIMRNEPFDRQGNMSRNPPPIEAYFSALALDDSPSEPLQFVIDCVNGFTCELPARLEEALKVRMIPLCCSPEEISIQRDPEPNTANAALLARMVRETGSNGGFLLNTDASRVLVVDEKGRPYSEELSFPLFASLILERNPTDLVTNYSTSKVIDQVARRFGVRVHRTDVGQSEVVHRAAELGCLLAGEGSGSVLFSPFSSGFDAFYFIREVVSGLKKTGRSLSDLLAGFPVPAIIKESHFREPGDIYSVLDKIGRSFPDSLRLKDGYYLEQEDSWICIRASATVNMIRLYLEGDRLGQQLAAIRELLK